MATRELEQRQKRTAPDVGEAALVMAVGIVVERISRLPAEDKADLFELLKGFCSAQTDEETESIRVAMLEILDDEQVRAVDLQRDDAHPEKLRRWIEYVSGQIRELRKAKKLTQDELAVRSGLPQSHISRLELGQHSPSRKTLAKVARGLAVPLNQLDPSA